MYYDDLRATTVMSLIYNLPFIYSPDDIFRRDLVSRIFKRLIHISNPTQLVKITFVWKLEFGWVNVRFLVFGRWILVVYTLNFGCSDVEFWLCGRW